MDNQVTTSCPLWVFFFFFFFEVRYGLNLESHASTCTASKIESHNVVEKNLFHTM